MKATASDVMRAVCVREDGQRFVFQYLPQYREQMLRLVTATAADPASAFDWDDAAAISNKIRGSHAT